MAPTLSKPLPLVGIQCHGPAFDVVESGKERQGLPATWLLWLACNSKNLRQAWAARPISMMPCWSEALYPL